MKSYYKRFQASTADNASSQSLTYCLWLIDPVPLPPNESLLDIPYHRYPNHLDDPNFQFSSLVTSDKAKMALKLQVGHAQGVNGKVGVTSCRSASVNAKPSDFAVRGGYEERCQERKSETKGMSPLASGPERTLIILPIPQERIRNKKNKDGQQRATAPANLTGASSGILSAASSPEYRGAMTPSYQSSRRPMTPTYGPSASSKTPGYSDRTPGYSSRTPGYSTKSAKTPGY